MSDEKKTYKFVCLVCGYEVEVDTPELPEDYVCPVCGVGPDQFELVEEEATLLNPLSGRDRCLKARRKAGLFLWMTILLWSATLPPRPLVRILCTRLSAALPW